MRKNMDQWWESLPVRNRREISDAVRSGVTPAPHAIVSVLVGTQVPCGIGIAEWETLGAPSLGMGEVPDYLKSRPDWLN